MKGENSRIYNKIDPVEEKVSIGAEQNHKKLKTNIGELSIALGISGTPTDLAKAVRNRCQ